MDTLNGQVKISANHAKGSTQFKCNQGYTPGGGRVTYSLMRVNMVNIGVNIQSAHLGHGVWYIFKSTLRELVGALERDQYCSEFFIVPNRTGRLPLVNIEYQPVCPFPRVFSSRYGPTYSSL